MPTEREAFGDVAVWIEVSMPGEGPLGNYTGNSTVGIPQGDPNRVRREADRINTSMPIGSKISSLDLNVMSNCSVQRAEMIVSQCMESATEDFMQTQLVVQQGSVTINSFFCTRLRLPS